MDDVWVNMPYDISEDEQRDSPTQRILGRMKNSLEALNMRLLINMKNGNGIPLATLLAQFALFTAILFARETGFYAEHDSRGFKTALSYQISALLVSNSWRLSRFGVIRRSCGFKVNTIANGACLILAILLEKFYEKSLSSLGFALSIAVSFLILLVIIRPSTDLGFFGFLIGVVGSVAYNLFGLKFRTWIVVAICILLLGFKSWLDKNWLEVKRWVPPPKRFSKSKIIEAVTVAGFYLVWDYNLFRTNFQNLNLPDSDSKSGTSISPIAIVSCVVISCVWLALILVPRLYYLFRIVRASLLIKLILRKDKWWNKFLLKGNDSFDYRFNRALKLALEHVEDGVALLSHADLEQLERESDDQRSDDLRYQERQKVNLRWECLQNMDDIVQAIEENDLAAAKLGTPMVEWFLRKIEDVDQQLTNLSIRSLLFRKQKVRPGSLKGRFVGSI